MAHAFEKIRAGQFDVAHRLAVHLHRIVGQGHRQGAVVFRLRQRVERAGLAGIGQLIAHLVAACGVQGACRLQQLLAARHVYEFLGQGHGQADDPRQV